MQGFSDCLWRLTLLGEPLPVCREVAAFPYSLTTRWMALATARGSRPGGVLSTVKVAPLVEYVCRGQSRRFHLAAQIPGPNHISSSFFLFTLMFSSFLPSLFSTPLPNAEKARTSGRTSESVRRGRRI